MWFLKDIFTFIMCIEINEWVCAFAFQLGQRFDFACGNSEQNGNVQIFFFLNSNSIFFKTIPLKPAFSLAI